MKNMKYSKFANTNKTVADIRAELNLSRAEFSRRFGIPIRTLENWESGVRSAPQYLISLLDYAAQSEKGTE